MNKPGLAWQRMCGPFTLVTLVDSQQLSDMCVRLPQIRQLLANHRCMSEPAKVNHARPRGAEPPQLTCRLRNSSKWLYF